MTSPSKNTLRIRPVEADDYEPWLADLIRRGVIEPPDDYVIEDPKET